jgi:hypothetical protein
MFNKVIAENDIVAEEFKAQIDKMPELTLWVAINQIGGDLIYMNHEMADGRLPESRKNHEILELLQAQIQYAVSKLEKFGIKDYATFTDPAERKEQHANYFKWFRWWESYFENLPVTEQQELDRKLNNDEDLSAYRPAGDWRDQ